MSGPTKVQLARLVDHLLFMQQQVKSGRALDAMTPQYGLPPVESTTSPLYAEVNKAASAAVKKVLDKPIHNLELLP